MAENCPDDGLFPKIPRGHTWSEAWRHECEARTVMTWPKAQRVEFYRKIAEKRGQDAAQRLVDKVRELAGSGSSESSIAG